MASFSHASSHFEIDGRAGKINCPKCFSVDVRRSARHGWRDFVRRFNGIFPWRCGVCGKRFYLPRRSLGTVDLHDHVLSAHYKVIETPIERS